MPLHRRLSNIITSKIVSYIAQQEALDSQCGYRRYKIKDIQEVELIESGFQFESEILINEFTD